MHNNGKIIAVFSISALIVISAFAFLATSVGPVGGSGQLKTFSNYNDLKSFIVRNTAFADNNPFPVMQFFQEKSDITAANSQSQASTAPTSGYSGTNIQVQGVDEADLVKTDGSYIYVASGDMVFIVKALPADSAQVVSKIQLNGSYTNNIYINNDKLVIISNEYSIFPMLEYASDGVAPQTSGSVSSMPSVVSNSSSSDVVAIYPPIFPIFPENMSVKIFDVSDKSSPVMVRDFEMNGTYSGSRMIGDYLYVVVNQPAEPFYNSTIILPAISDNNSVKQIGANEISYTDAPAEFYNFVTVVALNVADSSAPATYQSFLASSSSNMYVSQGNMYLTVPRYAVSVSPLGGLATSTTVSTDETLIYRLSLNGSDVKLEAQGSVPGIVLDQYSMDEYGGHFRIATTEWTGNGTSNNLFVLDLGLNITGSLQNLANGESIYSARFMGDRCYLVTFRQVDPFYVIDLSSPTSPTVLGYLKIAGVSEYLYPFDNNTIIAVGAQSGNVKLSLFDVTDVSSPKDISSYQFNATYSYTDAAYDPHAFLYDGSRSLLIIPVSMMVAGTEQWTQWQGVFVFGVSRDNGFALKGTVTNIEDVNNANGNSYIMRSLYIGNVLYTVSGDLIKMTDINSMVFLNEVELS